MRVPRDNRNRLRGFARQMRHEMTDAERRLWTLLRDRRLQGFKFRRQHPIAGFIVDFYCAKAQVAVESDGGQHIDSRYDEARDAKLRALGVRILRFPDDLVLKEQDVVLNEIYSAIEAGPHPTLSRSTGRGNGWDVSPTPER
jgi:very-short-patch-repair endonuclease